MKINKFLSEHSIDIIVTYVMVLCQFGILYEIINAKKAIIHKAGIEY
mgnify:CR=1 FL=1